MPITLKTPVIKKPAGMQESAIAEQEQARKELYDIVSSVLAQNCSTFKTWLLTRSTEAWSMIPAKAIELLSSHYTTVNAVINNKCYDEQGDIRAKIESDCQKYAAKLSAIRIQKPR